MSALFDQLDQLMLAARNALVGLSDQLTVGSTPMLDTKEDSTWIDVAIVPDSEEGSRRAGGTAELLLEVGVYVHASDPELVFRRSEQLCQIALDRLMAEDALLFFGDAGTTYERGPTDTGGSFAGVVIARLRKRGYRVNARPGDALGINILSTGALEFSGSISELTTKVADFKTLSAQPAPSAIVTFYGNADTGDPVELVDVATGIVVDSVVVPGAGIGEVTFAGVLEGEYRARINGNDSKLTALVTSQPQP